MGATDVSVTEFKGNATDLINKIETIKKHTKTLDDSLVDVLNHLNAIEQGFKNVNQITNNARRQTNNFNTSFDIGNAKKSVKSSTGFMTSDTGRGKLFRDYEQAVIDETKEITADISQRKNLRKQRADAETLRAQNEAVRAAKVEDRTSASYISDRAKIAEAKLLNAKNNQAGALNRDWKYQGGKALQNVGEQMRSSGVIGRVLGDALNTAGAFLKGPAAGLTAIFTNLASGIKDLGKAATEAYAEIESIKTQLGIVFSSQTQADSMFTQISQYAIKSPFGVQQTSELAVLLKQSGVYASDLMDTLRMLGDTAGGNMEKMKRIANNYAQIVSIGKASMLDMRQFAYAGIPIFEAVSKELGVSQQELRKLISDGKVTSDIIEKVFKDLTGINGIFNEATSKGAKTLKARLQNLQDAKQLAMSSIGEWGVKLGTNYGGDSIAESLLSTVENIWQTLRENVNTKNIEKSVAAIERSEVRIKALEKQLEYAKSTGDQQLIAVLTRELEAQRNIFDIDTQRNAFANSYDAKMAKLEEVTERFGEIGADKVDALIAKYQTELFEREKTLFNNSPADVLENYDEQTYEDYMAMKYAYEEIIEALKEYKKAVNDVTVVTEKEKRFFKEREILNAQSLSADATNKASDAATSLNASFNELAAMYEKSEEYQQKKEAEKLEILKAAQEDLKILAKNSDEMGNVDFTKLSREEFKNYAASGAFSARKLDIVEGKTTGDMQADRDLLSSQFNYAVEKISSEIAKDIISSDPTVRTALAEFKNSAEKINKIKDNKEYLQKFGTNLYDMQKLLQAMQDYAYYDDTKTLLSDLEDYLIQSTSAYQVRLGGEQTNIEDALGSGNNFIALWKRILATNTGLTTQGMKTPEETLDLYLSDVSNRKTVANVMKATLSTLGVSAATQLLKPSTRAMELPGTQGTGRYINQVDWKKSSEALKEFATQLSASTEVISAYRQSLEDEIAVLENIVIQGATEMESQDLEKQKLVSVKTLAKYSNEASTQLVNALGDTLMTQDGLAVHLVDGEFFDEQGHKVALESLHISDNIFEVINKFLPQIKQELAEARAGERNNEELSKWLKDVLPNELSKIVNSSDSEYKASISGFLLDNQDYLTDQFYNAFDEVMTNYASREGFGDITQRNKEDIITAALMANSDEINRRRELGEDVEYYDQALELVTATLGVVRDYAGRLGVGMEGSSFENLRSKSLTAQRDEAARNRYRKLFGYSSANQLSATAWPDEGGYDFGSKLMSDITGVSKGYTMNDLYQQRADELKTTIDMLPDVEKRTIYWKEALEDTLDVMKSLGDETASLVGQLSQKAFLTPFEKMGEQLINGKEWTEQTADAMADLGAEALTALGPIMAKAGFELVARGALNNNWAMITGGLALAAAGGFASGLGGALSEAEKDTKDDKQAEKLQSLKDQLADLLDQARRDALYYENNLRHKTALGINKEFDYQSVNDAIITPQGSVITTDPKDYLIATKTPGQFGGGNVTVTPIINCNVVNNTNAKVTQQQVQNPDGSIDILTIIEDKMGEYIASSKSDDAFASREYRIRGKQSVMN